MGLYETYLSSRIRSSDAGLPETVAVVVTERDLLTDGGCETLSDVLAWAFEYGAHDVTVYVSVLDRAAAPTLARELEDVDAPCEVAVREPDDLERADAPITIGIGLGGRSEFTAAIRDLAEAVEAAGTRDRLELLAHARGPARAVEAAWATIEADLTAADVRSARQTVEEDLREFRDGRAYVGEDPVRAVVVHALVGDWLREADRDLRADPDESSPVTPITIGERASEVEQARAALDDARHVRDRFTESLTDSRALAPTFADARDSLAETIDSRMADKPAENADLGDLVDGGGDLEGTVAGTALRQLHGELPYEGEFVPETDLPGRVLWQVETLAQIGAFESLRARIAADEHRTVETADDVSELRSAAVAAVEDALETSADERLARTELASLASWFDYVADTLDRYGDGPVERDLIADDVALYLQIEVIAAAVPAAVDEALAALGVQ